MLHDARGIKVDGKILGSQEVLLGFVSDVQALLVPIWPSVLGEGSDKRFAEVLAPCVILTTPRIDNPFRPGDDGGISDYRATIPLIYDKMKFNSIV